MALPPVKQWITSPFQYVDPMPQTAQKGVTERPRYFVDCWNTLEEKYLHRITTVRFLLEATKEMGRTSEDVISDPPEQYMQAERLIKKAQISQAYPVVHRSLENVKQLRSGWDTYGAPAIPSHIIDLAYAVLFDIKEAVEKRGGILPEPFVVPGADGTMQFEWKLGEREFELEIMSSGDQLQYAYLLCHGRTNDKWEEGEFSVSPLEHPSVRQFISWI